MDVFAKFGNFFNPVNNSEELRTLAVINKISGMCAGCNEQHNISDMERKKYLHPYEKRVMSGLFCKDCLNDPSVKILLK